MCTNCESTSFITYLLRVEYFPSRDTAIFKLTTLLGADVVIWDEQVEGMIMHVDDWTDIRSFTKTACYLDSFVGKILEAELQNTYEGNHYRGVHYKIKGFLGGCK